MRRDDAFPSNYLKADTAEVPEDGHAIYTIKCVEMRTLGQGKDAQDKPVVFFEETAKALVLNKTNWGLIGRAIGSDDTDHWEGKKIALYSTDVQYGGDMVRGIRVLSRTPQPKRKPVAEMTAAEAEEEGIPF